MQWDDQIYEIKTGILYVYEFKKEGTDQIF